MISWPSLLLIQHLKVQFCTPFTIYGFAPTSTVLSDAIGTSLHLINFAYIFFSLKLSTRYATIYTLVFYVLPL